MVVKLLTGAVMFVLGFLLFFKGTVPFLFEGSKIGGIMMFIGIILAVLGLITMAGRFKKWVSS
ncbi:hypothetical protein HOE04_02070 [archaeon]|jgi:hypothetical protein|nr:hypothetical protein [archaeon]